MRLLYWNVHFSKDQRVFIIIYSKIYALSISYNRLYYEKISEELNLKVQKQQVTADLPFRALYLIFLLFEHNHQKKIIEKSFFSPILQLGVVQLIQAYDRRSNICKFMIFHNWGIHI